jgi:hypothetical protein
MEATDGAQRSGYPFGVIVIVVGLALRVVSLVALLISNAGSGPLAWLAGGAPLPDLPIETAAGIVIRVVAIGLLIASVLAIIGLLRRSQSGWVLAVVTSGAVLAVNLGWWASGEPRYLSMAVNAVVLLYLNQRDLRAYFGDPT